MSITFVVVSSSDLTICSHLVFCLGAKLTRLDYVPKLSVFFILSA